MGLAHHIARRYSRRGVDDDVAQVAFLALVKAVERFDIERGVQFSSFAGRTIEGEIKRHFRDSSWSVRVPRRLKDDYLQIETARETLNQQLGRSPTPSELADYLELDTDDRAGGDRGWLRPHGDEHRRPGRPRRSGAETSVTSTRDSPASPTATSSSVCWTNSRSANGRSCVCASTTSSRRPQIAEHVGISQMHVSRLLRRSLEAMRADL